MVSTGGRVHDISLLHKQQHVEEKLDHAGEPAIMVLINNIKNRRGDVCETWITGDAYRDVKAWIDRRKTICLDSPFFFVTNTGTQISACSVSMSLDTLCKYAGYGPRFFSAHSGRMAFASRAAALILANGGSIRDVFDRMSVTGLWAPGSTAIERYCDTGTRKFFEGPNPLTWTQFTRLSPEIMHDLEPLNPPRRREAAWFHQDINKLRMIAMNLGRRFPPNADQYKIRLFIGKTFFRRDPALRNWLREFHSLETVDSSRGVKPITLLLERDRIPPSAEFQLESLSAEEIRELEVDMTDHPPYTDRSILYPPRQRARRVREVRIIEGEHLREVATLFQNRVADKQVTIGILPNSNRFIIKTRELDRNCSEVHFIGSAHAPSMQSVNSAERF
jgi:hypothetical protein